MQDKPRSHVYRHPPPENELKKSKLSGKQALKKYPEIMLIPTRFVGVNFCIKEVS
tara:strand:- start:589 stop:753 length:165 start_codon:yes stop_codon:yes gene_type:complete